MSESPIAIATAFVRAINRQDVGALTALMPADHRFVDPLGKTHQGREIMREGWAGYFRMVPDYSVAIEETYVEGPVVLMLGMAQGTYTADGAIKAENRWETPIAIRALIEDELIAEWRIYADNEPIRKRMSSS